MKNIHVLPTDKGSRLFYNLRGALVFANHQNYKGVNIYITSDEPAYPYALHLKNQEVLKINAVGENSGELYHDKGFSYPEDCKKIILTTDQDLIKNGVQAINDEFLEWFVENPSCEEVGVKKYHGINTSIAEVNAISGYGSLNWQGKDDLRDYKIIIPKEEAMNMKEEFEKSVNIIIDWFEKNGEPVADKQVEQEAEKLFKQETLEEFAEQEAIKQYPEDTFGNLIVRKSIEKGAKWQQKRMYSEEDLIDAFNEGQAFNVRGKLIQGKEWFKQFKNK